MIRAPICLIAAIATAACAARTPAPAESVVAGRVATTAGDRASASAREIEAHLRFLASDALNGRGSGTRDEWIAATYLGAQLARLGLEPMGDDGWFVQQVEVQRFAPRAAPTLAMGEQTLTHGGAMLVRSVVAPAVTGPLHRYAPETPVPPGSAVVMPANPPATALSALGSAAIVLQRETPAMRQRWGAMASRPAAVAPQIVGVPAPPSPATTFVTLDAASHDAALAAAPGTPVTVTADYAPSTRTTTWNAVGRLTGADPAGASEVVVLSAHLDHVGARAEAAGPAVADAIYNGADDDASGVVAVLEIMRMLEEGPRPRRTVVAAFFGSEEAGGFGSRYFVTRPVVPLTDIVANLQFEMIGRPDPLVPPGTLWLTGYERSTLGPSLAGHGARLVQDPRPDQRFFERSDNIQFARRGVVAHTVSSYGMHGEYHEPSDEVRHINLAHMTDAITSLLAPVRWLVDGSDRPAWHEGMRP